MPNRAANECRSCHAPVRWVRTAKGQPMPLDREPNPAGNVTLQGAVATVHAKGAVPTDAGPVYMPHHATCKDVAKWRR